MKDILHKQFWLYMIRWQLSTPILAPVIAWIKNSSTWFNAEDWMAASIANLIGGFIFYWIDKYLIFKS